ncbi:MAG: DUF1963 domain-containing protein [Polyangiales bacterium]
MKIYLEFAEGTSSKFWSVEVEGSTHIVRYGRIGTDGRSKESSFASDDDALADAEKQAGKKRKKGYADAEPSAPAPAAKKAAKQKATKKKATKKTPSKTGAKKATKKPAKKLAAASARKKTASKKPKKAKPPSARTIKSFFKAMREGNIERVQAELDRAIDANLLYDIQEDGDPWSVLYHAVFHRQTEVANLLLERGADATFRLKSGAGPLHHVGDAALCKRLLDSGAAADGAGAHKYTPLHRARSADIARALLDGGADVNAEDKEGRTPYETKNAVALRDVLLEYGSSGLKTTDGAPFDVEISEVPFNEVDANRGTIALAEDGALWLGGYSGLYRVAEGKCVRYAAVGHGPAIDTIASAHGIVYISTNWGLLAFDGKGFRLYNHANSPLHDQHITQMAVVDDEVYCVGYESEVESKHISVFDGTTWRLLRPRKDLPAKCDTRCMMRNAAGRLVLSDNEEGGIYTRQDGEWRYDNFGKDFFTPKVYVMASRAGVDYFGTHSGLFRRAKGGELELLTQGAVGQLAWIGDTLWAATNWDGVYAIEGTDVEHYTSDRAGVELSNVEAMTATREGTLYILTGRFLIQMKDGAFCLVEKPASAEDAAYEPPPKLPLPEGRFVDADKIPSAWVATVSDASIEGLEEGALARLVQPAIGVAVDPGKAAAGASKLGGLPDLPKGTKWPKYEDNDDHLPFILQLNCAEFSPFDVEGLLPKEGHFYLFADTSAEDEEGSRLVYAKGAPAPRALPKDLEQRAGMDDFVATIDERPLRFFTQFTLPSGEWLDAHSELSDADGDTVDALRQGLEDSTEWSSTQILGWPSPVQGEFLGDERSLALLQLDSIGEFGHWIVDGLRYWIIDRDSLAACDWDEIFCEYQYT